MKQWFVASTIKTTGSQEVQSERHIPAIEIINKKVSLVVSIANYEGRGLWYGMVWSFGGWEHKDRLNPLAKELEVLMTNVKDRRYGHVLAQIKQGGEKYQKKNIVSHPSEEEHM